MNWYVFFLFWTPFCAIHVYMKKSPKESKFLLTIWRQETMWVFFCFQFIRHEQMPQIGYYQLDLIQPLPNTKLPQCYQVIHLCLKGREDPLRLSFHVVVRHLWVLGINWILVLRKSSQSLQLLLARHHRLLVSTNGLVRSLLPSETWQVRPLSSALHSIVSSKLLQRNSLGSQHSVTFLGHVSRPRLYSPFFQNTLSSEYKPFPQYCMRSVAAVPCNPIPIPLLGMVTIAMMKHH